MRGHNLCWHSENPDWLNNGNFSADELSKILVSHVTTVVKHYGTRAYCWDVVNEALDNNGLKPSKPWCLLRGTDLFHQPFNLPLSWGH